jgi:hypothetical protein
VSPQLHVHYAPFRYTLLDLHTYQGDTATCTCARKVISFRKVVCIFLQLISNLIVQFLNIKNSYRRRTFLYDTPSCIDARMTGGRHILRSTLESLGGWNGCRTRESHSCHRHNKWVQCGSMEDMVQYGNGTGEVRVYGHKAAVVLCTYMDSGEVQFHNG